MDDDKVHEIIIHEAEADKAEASASKHRWEAARLISEELASGTSQRDLARALGYKSHTTVLYKSRAWEKFGLLGDRPPWNEAYHSAGVRAKPKAKADPEDKTLGMIGDASDPVVFGPTDPVPVITGKDAIAKRLTVSGSFRKWLMSQGEAEMTETDDAISLVVQKH